MNTTTLLSKSISGYLFAAVLLVGDLTAGATTSVWLDATTGIWTNPARWVSGNVPGANTNDVSINVDGTYTSQWDYPSQSITNGAMEVGTTTSSGTQTLLITGWHTSKAGVLGVITIGARGVFDQRMPLSDLGTGTPSTVYVRNGGLYMVTTNSEVSEKQWTMGQNRTLVVDAGGRVLIGPGGGLYITEYAYNFALPSCSTNNGLIEGEGALVVGAGSSQLRLAGSGTVDGPGSCLMANNSALTLGGTLMFNRNFIQSDSTRLGDIYFADGANITMNGDVVWTNTSSAFFESAGATASVSGRGLIDITYNSAISYFGCQSYISKTTTNLLAGTGKLELRTAGNTVRMWFNQFTLSRTGTVHDAGGILKVLNGRKMFISGTGGLLAMTAGTTLSILHDAGYEPYSYVRVRNGGSLSLAGARVEGNASGDPYVLHFSDDNTAASLIIASESTNTMAGIATNATLSVRLGTNAAVNVGANSRLTLSNAVLHVAMTNSAQWGWSSQGTLAIGTNVQMEALSTDHGYNVSVADEPFSINRLAFVSDNSTLTLTNSVGTGKKALYVKNLDLSALSPGATVNLQGFSGAERVFYSNLLNPNNATFVTPAEWVLIPSEATMIIIM